MSCEFPIYRYVQLLPDGDEGCASCGHALRRVTEGVCCYGREYSCTVEFLGSRYEVQPGGADPTDPEDGFKPLYGTCGPPSDRFALYTSGIGGENGATVPVIDFQIRAGIGCVVTKVFEGIFTATSLTSCDLVVQVSGPLATNWEIWARSPNATRPFIWKLIAAVDKSRQCATECPPIVGPMTTTVFSLVVGPPVP